MDAYTIAKTSKSSVFKGTWQGRPGTSTEYRLTGSRDGLRVIEHKWDDEPTAIVRVVEGNAYTRPDRFVQYLRVEDVQVGQGAALAGELRAAIFEGSI